MERKPTVDVRIRPYEPADHPRMKWLLERTPPWGRTQVWMELDDG